MAVLVLAESTKGKFKKTAQEAVYYASKLAAQKGSECVALVLGTSVNPSQLGQFGAAKVLHDANRVFDNVDSQQYAVAISSQATAIGATHVVVAATSTGKSIIGRVGVRLDAGVVSSVNALPSDDNTFSKGVFSGKATVYNKVTSDVTVLSLMGNSLQFTAEGGDVAAVSVSIDVPTSKVVVREQKTLDGIVPLPEAEVVVSAGRGMKGPENWSIIEELAQVLGATTACSRPVADIGWRPHHEHVGQTGVAIKPNLYIAAGISGAIQHLAGVNSSKVIVVINKDPEAPFFKAADYGVVGDLFEVVPKLTEALKKFKQYS
jgi:electron transfer flavoprotein alpha subunit